MITHVYNAHTDGDSYVYFADANVICTGDIMNNNHRYQQVDFANGGDIRGMIQATDGNFYRVTALGGANSVGFRAVDPEGCAGSREPRSSTPPRLGGFHTCHQRLDALLGIAEEHRRLRL